MRLHSLQKDLLQIIKSFKLIVFSTFLVFGSCRWRINYADSSYQSNFLEFHRSGLKHFSFGAETSSMIPRPFVLFSLRKWKSMNFRFLLSRFAFLIYVVFVFEQTAHSQTSIGLGAKFDHFETSFPLVGAHIVTTCESCHRDGNFRGTPRQCKSCHNGIFAVGKSSKHIATNGECDICHNSASDSWGILARAFDHATVVGACMNCHNGASAAGKNSFHIRSTNRCDACHATNSWNATIVNHSDVLGSCVSCHDGLSAPGKVVNHILSSDGCANCHNTIAFKPVNQVDHGQVRGACESCHNGITATGKSSNHIPTTQSCIFCHTTESFS